MKTAAIICEYNPFHNGHRYLIKKALSEHGFDRVICIMSGNYVQRGEPAVIDKYTRAEWALRAGAEAVIEIPPVFATSSAKEFSACAVHLADSLGIVDGLVFGTEGNVTLTELTETAEKLKASEKENRIVELTARGLSYPEALTKAGFFPEKLSSNNILAIEYLRSLSEVSGRILPVPVKRTGDPYSACRPSDHAYTSATAIRNMLHSGTSDPDAYLPDFVREKLTGIVHPDMLSPLLTRAILDADDLTVYQDVSAEIAGRIEKSRNRLLSFSQRIDETRTKQYTRSRISRALLHIALGMTKEEFLKQKSENYNRYVRVLGLKAGSAVLSEIKEKAALPLISRTAQYEEMLSRDIYYDQLYYALTCAKGEYERSPVVLCI